LIYLIFNLKSGSESDVTLSIFLITISGLMILISIARYSISFLILNEVEEEETADGFFDVKSEKIVYFLVNVI
jgi:hypothetical protein